MSVPLALHTHDSARRSLIMRSRFLLLSLCLVGFGCATSNSSLNDSSLASLVSEEGSHYLIDFGIVPNGNEPNKFEVTISLIQHESTIVSERRDGFSHQEGYTQMSFPRFSLDAGEEAELTVGGNMARVFIDEDLRKATFNVFF